MPGKLVKTATEISIRVAAAGVGTAIAGPLGCALGAAFGHAISGPLGELIRDAAKDAGSKAAEKFFDAGGDALADWAKGSEGDLEGAYREALRLSLHAMRRGSGDDYEDWFEHWERCLETAEVLRLEEIGAEAMEAGQLALVLRRTMVRLDAQGAALFREASSIATLDERVMPEELETVLATRLPGEFDRTFQRLIASDKYAAAYRVLILNLEKDSNTRAIRMEGQMALLPQLAAEIASLPGIVSDAAQQTAASVKLSADSIDNSAVLFTRSIDRFLNESQERRYRAAMQGTEPLYSQTDSLWNTFEESPRYISFEGLEELEKRQIQILQEHIDKVGYSSYAVGLVREQHLDWSGAFRAYKQAWELLKSYDSGVRYAKSAFHCQGLPAAVAILRSLIAIQISDDQERRLKYCFVELSGALKRGDAAVVIDWRALISAANPAGGGIGV